MSTPGAVTSGLRAPSMPGPRLEKSASTSLSSTAPTVRAAAALPGEPMVCSPKSPSLPAAMANRTPFSSESLFTPASSASIAGVSPPPRLMLMTSAPSAAAHSMPARISESLPNPPSSRTLPLRIFAPGATPLYLPPDFLPVPAAMEATCVPWPTLSVVSGEVVKFLAPTTWPLRSSWVASTPVSRTAIVTPLPS